MKKRLMPELPEEVEEVFAELAREEEKIIKKAKEEIQTKYYLLRLTRRQERNWS